MKVIHWLCRLLSVAFPPPPQTEWLPSPPAISQSSPAWMLGYSGFQAHVEQTLHEVAERRVVQLLHELHEEKLLYMDSSRRAYHPAGRQEIGLQGKLINWVWMWLVNVRDLNPTSDQLFRAWLEASKLRDQIRAGRDTNFQHLKHLVAEVRMGRVPL